MNAGAVRIYRCFLFCLSAFLLYSGSCFPQSRWQRVYHEEWDAPVLDIQVAYDGGYLLSGRQIPNYPRYNWLIKTDVNGEILWEKLIGDGENCLVMLNFSQNSSGDVFLVGTTMGYGDYSDPIILKLDSCGSKQWCRVLPSYDNLDYAYDVCGLPDGGCAVTLRYTGTEPGVDRICLMKLNTQGDELWRHCYNSADTNLFSPEHYDLIVTPDKGFLISGFCYYADPDPPHAGWPHPYYIKTDSLGNFEWELVAQKETADYGGIATGSLLSPDQQYYYSWLGRYYHVEPYGDCPAFAVFDHTGSLIRIEELASPGYFGYLFSAAFLNDSTLVGSAIWGDESNFPVAIRFDTAGNILDQAPLLENEYMSYVRKTDDQKFLFYTEHRINDQFDAFLFKLNQDLANDTLILDPLYYDFLCPGYILSDTIVPDDCGIIVGTPEPAGNLQVRKGVRLFPNPARDMITASFAEELIPERLCVYNTMGQLQDCVTTKGRNSVEIDIGHLPPGIYILTGYSDQAAVIREMFVKAI